MYLKNVRDETSSARELFPYYDFLQNDTSKLLLIITRKCQLRCRYCKIKKTNDDMPESVLRRGVDFLFTTHKRRVELHFYGIEPLMRFDLVKVGSQYAEDAALRKMKELDLVLTTNGVGLTPEILRYVEEHKFKLEVSLDGVRETQNKNRPSVYDDVNSYDSVISHLDDVLRLKTRCYVIMICHPEDAQNLHRNFSHLVALGVRDIQINYAMGMGRWDDERMAVFMRQLESIAEEFFGVDNTMKIHLENMKWKERIYPYCNEICMDYDGSLYGTNIFLSTAREQKKVYMGKVKESSKTFDEYQLERLPRTQIGKTLFAPHVYNSDMKMAKMMQHFVRSF